MHITCNWGNKKLLQDEGKKHSDNTCAFDTMTPNWLLPKFDIANETD